MTNDEKLQAAKKVYSIVCDALDGEGWQYEKNEDRLSVEAITKGDDFPITFYMKAHEKTGALTFVSKMPFVIPHDKRMDVALAICMINDSIVNGFFDFNIPNGEVYFRMSSTFIGVEMSKEVPVYLLYSSCSTVDRYNDVLFMISKGMMSLSQLEEMINKN